MPPPCSLHAAFLAACDTPETKEAMAGNIIKPSTPEEAALYFRSEMTRCAALAKKSRHCTRLSPQGRARPVNAWGAGQRLKHVKPG